MNKEFEQDEIVDDASENKEDDEDGLSLDNEEFDDSSEDDFDDDEEMDEEDRKFIADDDEEETSKPKHGDEDEEELAERKRLRKEKRRKLKELARQTAEDANSASDEHLSKKRDYDDELDEDDLELVRENMGLNRPDLDSEREKYRQKTRAGLDNLFEQRDEEEFDDDLDDFVVEDEEGEDEEGDREQTKVRPDRDSKLDRQRKRKAFAETIHVEFGISDRAWNDIRDIFGDGTDYEDILQKQEQMAEVGGLPEDVNLDQGETAVSKTLEKIFEPAEIQERMLTENDERIREQDVPERFVTRSIFVPPEKEEIPRESAWIARYILWERELKRVKSLDPRYTSPEDRKIPLLSDINDASAIVPDVTTIVSFIRSLHLEIPFILRYREDYWDGKFSQAELWRIYDLDESWQALELRRKKLFGIWSKITELNPEGSQFDKVSVTESLDTCISLDDLDDISELFRARYATELQHLEQAAGSTARKRLQMSAYESLKSKKALEFMYQFGVDPYGYARSYAEGVKLLKFNDPVKEPLELAPEFAEGGLDAKELILHAATSGLVAQLASEPLVRRTIRKFLFQDACITVVPTSKGRDEIDRGHIFYGIKYIKQKPVRQMSGVDYLYMQQAEQLGLVTVEVRIMFEDEFIQDALSFIRGDGETVREAWSKVRESAMHTTLKRILLPQIEKQVRGWLRERASSVLFDRIRSKLEEQVNMQPFGLDKVEKSWRKADIEGRKRRNPLPTVKVLSLTWGDGSRDTATVGVLMVGSGAQVIDTIKLDNLQAKDLEKRDADMKQLEQFLADHEPDAICIGGFTPLTRHLFTLISEFVNSKMLDIRVLMVADDLARIFMNSERSRKKLPHLPQLMVYAVGLCRQMLDPLAFAASFINRDRELLLLQLDPAQKWVSPDSLYEHMQRALVNVVSTVGVDLVEALQVEWKQSLLQVVPGLGPRKASLLLAKSLRTHEDEENSDEEASVGAIEGRDELLKQRWMGANIYVNCAGFLRIPKRHFSTQDAYRIEILDNTLIHPEEYDFPRKMAADALDEEVVAYEGDEGGKRASEYIEELLSTNSAYKLDALELEDFAQWMRDTKKVEKLKALEQIRRELQNFDVDPRPVFRPARPEQVFQMLTGESVVLYSPGLPVSGSVNRILDSGVSVRLNGGLFGFIPSRLLPHGADPFQLFQPGQPIEAKVQFLDLEKFLVTLSLDTEHSSRAEQIRQSLALDAGYVAPDTRHWNDDLEKQHEEQQKVEMQRAMKKVVRPIQHPFFRNLPDFAASAAFLKENVQMPYVIRRAGDVARGESDFVITWRVYDETFVQIKLESVTARMAQHVFSDTNPVQHEYLINGKEYHGFDEVHARFMQPLMHYVALLLEHPKFHRHPLSGQPAGREITRGFLEQSYYANGGKYAVYRICCDDLDDPSTHHKAIPGRFLFGIKNHKERPPVFLLLNVSYEGYHFQGELYPTVQLMIDAYKGRMMNRQREARIQESKSQHSRHHESPRKPRDSNESRMYRKGKPNNPNSIPVQSSNASSW